MPFIEYKQGLPFTAVTFPYNVCDALIVQNLQLERLISYININKISKIKIDDIDDLSFLRQCPSVKHICLEIKAGYSTLKNLEKKGKYYVKTVNLSEIYSLSELRSVDFQVNVEPTVKLQLDIDLSKLNNIEDISVEYKFLRNLSKANNLKSFNVIDFKPKSKNFDELNNLTNLDSIRIVKGNLESIEGIQNLKNIQCLYMHRLSSLSDIERLQDVAKTLKALRIENCNKIKDFSVIEKLVNVELLELSGNNELPNLDFLKSMKNLKTFLFSMNVLNGDLSPCKRLSYVYSEKNRKHYNIRDDNLPKGNYVRGNESIDEWRRSE